jgi:hypothetical protein
MQTLTIDIINTKALRLLKDMEQQKLIHVRKDKKEPAAINWAAKYKGAMTKQPLTDIANQINELRNG